MSTRARAHRLAGFLALGSILLPNAACQPPAEPQAEQAAVDELDPAEVAEHRRRIEEWHAGRVESLTAEEGWLSLAGLAWLREGANRVGSDPEAEVVLPEGKAPARVGTLYLRDGRASIEALPESGLLHEGEPVDKLELLSDADEGGPTRLELGGLLFYAIRRGDRVGIRVKDRQHPARVAFQAIERYPVDAAWRISARFDEHDPPLQIPVPNILGMVNDTPSWGAVVFERDGETHRLDALASPGDEELFIIFADRTTGHETYGGGRYLYSPAPTADGTVVLDFNKAYNPPCVFTPFATCPLPPRQNRLALEVEAGEKMWGGEAR